ncbi:MAG: ABC transporter substrate-binding protein [Candidatus Methylacidiphilales bacterium]
METKLFTDQLGRSVTVNFPPKRIVSLVPSQTEFLYDLGLDSEIVGQTLFCIHPKSKHKTKTIIGGTKNLKLDIIAQLKPDLIIGNKEENEQKQIEYLMHHFPVWMSDIYTLEDSFKMMESLGQLVYKTLEANQIVNQIKLSFSDLKLFDNPNNKVAYFIWRNPYMVAANHTFINHLLQKLNFSNVFANHLDRYPQITNEDLVVANPDFIFLSSEPYPFKEKHIAELQQLLPKAKILLVDGEMFSWYGSRLLHSVRYFGQLQAQLSN